MVSGEKRTNEEENFMEKITTILLDIEGTTTSVSFVKDTLFPYVKEHLQSYVDSHWDDSEFKEDVAALKEQAKKDEEEKIEGFCPIEEGEKEKESLMKNVLWQMSIDRKTTALKQLQGHIWREGYKNGKIKGHVYSDVVPALKKWREESRRVYIFSSGSVEAQKLLFGHSEEGDLLEYISGYFDTAVGPKNESSSYTNIIKSMECEKDQVLFLTDVVKEAEAAQTAGMKIALVVRENNPALTDDEKKEFMTVTSLNELICDNSVKRKKLNDEEVVVEKKSEKEPEEKAEAEKETKSNGTEEMEVDVAGNESKPESAEKTGNKTEEEAKTESDEIEVDVVSEEEKKEQDGQEDDEESCKENGEEESTGQQEPQVDVADPTPASDPLDISGEKQEEGEEGKKETEKSTELKNGNAEGEEEKSEETKPNGEAEKGKEKVEGKEINGDAVHEEKKENGVGEESIPVSKIVPEDKPEPTVEVNA